jgi:hypothetical protein
VNSAIFNLYSVVYKKNKSQIPESGFEQSLSLKVANDFIFIINTFDCHKGLPASGIPLPAF